MCDGRKIGDSLFYLEAGMLWLSGKNERPFLSKQILGCEEKDSCFWETGQCRERFLLAVPDGNTREPGSAGAKI